jgi:CheY-like chemotaxis protein
MNGHGKLIIEAGNDFLEDSDVARHLDVTAGQYVMIAVTDTGCGIPSELIDRVFEPFFTTKPEGKGTGLGLSMVYGFVKQSGGHIKISSEPGHGTTVRLYLPRANAPEDFATDTDIGSATGGRETVLVVEDDDEVRSIVVEMVSELGYRVLKANDAQAALAIVESGVPIDLLFTDVIMPGPLRSPELARKARERLPNIAVLFTSGYTENAIVHDGRLDEGLDLLSKPYSREALARKFRHTLRNQQHRNLSVTPAKHPSPPRDNDSRKTVSPRRLRVLLVEDDELIREITAEMLANLGHSVIETASAEEALASLDRHTPDVMITDLNLPGLSGSDLAAQAIGQKPELRIVFASGYDVTPSATRRAVVLPKPYNEQALAGALKAAMTSGSSTPGLS